MYMADSSLTLNDSNPIEEKLVINRCHYCRNPNVSVTQIVKKDWDDEKRSFYYVECLHCSARGPEDISTANAVHYWNSFSEDLSLLEFYEQVVPWTIKRAAKVLHAANIGKKYDK